MSAGGPRRTDRQQADSRYDGMAWHGRAERLHGYWMDALGFSLSACAGRREEVLVWRLHRACLPDCSRLPASCIVPAFVRPRLLWLTAWSWSSPPSVAWSRVALSSSSSALTPCNFATRPAPPTRRRATTPWLLLRSLLCCLFAVLMALYVNVQSSPNPISAPRWPNYPQRAR